MPIFFVVLFSLYLAGNLYIFLKGRLVFRAQSTGVKVLLSFLFWGCALLFFVSFLFRNVVLPPALARTAYQVGTGWLVFTLYMVLLLGVFDLMRLFHWKFKYGYYLSLALTLSVLGYGYYHYQHPRTQVINIVINKPAVKNGPDTLRVAAVSDIHLGYGTDKAMLQQYVQRIHALKPDVILIGGDLIDSSIVPLEAERMDEELAQLKAPYGVYMVPGNHEYITGIEASVDFIRKTPIVLLRDSVVTLPNGFHLVGRDDRHNRARKPLKELMLNLPADEPVILLDHQPYELAETARAGIDLQFSGHTHHGQIWPLNWLTDRLFEVSYGYKEMGPTRIYVSSGLSLWGPPFRIGTDSELVLFEIVVEE